MMKAFSASFRTKTSALKIDEDVSFRKNDKDKLETIPSPRAASLPPLASGGASKVTTKTTTTTSTFTVKTSFTGVSLASKVGQYTLFHALHNILYCDILSTHPSYTPYWHTLSTHTISTHSYDLFYVTSFTGVSLASKVVQNECTVAHYWLILSLHLCTHQNTSTSNSTTITTMITNTTINTSIYPYTATHPSAYLVPCMHHLPHPSEHLCQQLYQYRRSITHGILCVRPHSPHPRCRHRHR